MPFSLSVWSRNLFRPRLTRVRVLVYENGKQKDLSTYNDFKLAELVRCIDEYWRPEQKYSGNFWFETEVFERKTCTRKGPVEMYVCCYGEHKVNPGVKQKTDIPIRYRGKMFDKSHLVVPKTMAGVPWPQRIELKFTNVK